MEKTSSVKVQLAVLNLLIVNVFCTNIIFTSTLDSTGIACPNEEIVFTCTKSAQFITWNIIIFNDSVEIQLSIVQDEVSESDLEGTGVCDVLKFKAVLTEHEGSSFSSVLTIHLAPDNTTVSCESDEHKVIRYIGLPVPPPSLLNKKQVGNTITIAWSPPVFEGQGAITSYQILVKSAFYELKSYTDKNITRYTASRLSFNMNYNFSVAAVVCGKVGQFSEPLVTNTGEVAVPVISSTALLCNQDANIIFVTAKVSELSYSMKVLVDYISELEGAVVHSGSVSCLSGTSCIITDAIENSVYNLSAVAVSEYGVSNWSDVLSLVYSNVSSYELIVDEGTDNAILNVTLSNCIEGFSGRLLVISYGPCSSDLSMSLTSSDDTENGSVVFVFHNIDPQVEYCFEFEVVGKEISDASSGLSLSTLENILIVLATALVMFFLITSALVCLCYNPRRLKAAQTSTSTSGTTSALPPGPVYEEVTTENKKRADQMEMKGNVAYGPSNELPLEQNVAYEIL